MKKSEKKKENEFTLEQFIAITWFITLFLGLVSVQGAIMFFALSYLMINWRQK